MDSLVCCHVYLMQEYMAAFAKHVADTRANQGYTPSREDFLRVLHDMDKTREASYEQLRLVPGVHVPKPMTVALLGKCGVPMEMVHDKCFPMYMAVCTDKADYSRATLAPNPTRKHLVVVKESKKVKVVEIQQPEKEPSPPVPPVEHKVLDKTF